MADSRDITGKNRKFTGTTGIKLPTGTEAQRVNEQGQLRFNSDTNLAEYYDGTDWKSIDAPPSITGFTVDGGSSVTSAEIDNEASGDATIVIQGSNFDTTSGTVVFESEGGGSNVSVQTITRTSSSSFTVTVTRSDFTESSGPYAIKLTNGSGLAATLASAITADDSAPSFATAADTTVLSSYEGQAAPFSETTLAATDADGDTVTHTISAGSLPPGLSLSTAGALTGTISGSSIQNYTFTVSAATTTLTSTRQFVIAITASPYIEASGGTVTTDGDYKVHKFTGNSTFVVSNAGTPAGATTVEYLVVAGGGGGGGGDGTHGGGGAGAGGYRTATGFPISATTYPITIGGGGGAASTGGNSVFSTITSAGGGSGGNGYKGGGGSGGSGGGSGVDCGGRGTGNSPPVSPPQGNPGAFAGGTGYGGGGGGGGAGASGNAGTAGPGNAYGGAGGNGSTSSIDGTPTARAGGRGGASRNCVPANASGGSGGGGPASPGTGNPGSVNTGGGGGAGHSNGSSGGSGIVIIRYQFQ